MACPRPGRLLASPRAGSRARQGQQLARNAASGSKNVLRLYPKGAEPAAARLFSEQAGPGRFGRPGPACRLGWRRLPRVFAPSGMDGPFFRRSPGGVRGAPRGFGKAQGVWLHEDNPVAEALQKARIVAYDHHAYGEGPGVGYRGRPDFGLGYGVEHGAHLVGDKEFH